VLLSGLTIVPVGIAVGGGNDDTLAGFGMALTVVAIEGRLSRRKYKGR
jgi:hypothetical protein